jgi:hypothetical protein
MRMIQKHYPHVEWVISFADGCQCGDGTIYRAAGFVLTGIKVEQKPAADAGWLGHAQDDASDGQEPRGSFRENRRIMIGPGRAA